MSTSRAQLDMYLIGTVVSGLTVLGACGFYIRANLRSRAESGGGPAVQRLVDIRPDELIDPASLCLGSADAKDRVVIFSDYQCPPCRAEWGKIKALMAEKRNSAVYLKHLPLSSIHEYAMGAAVAAEVAKARGHFAAMTEMLFTGELGTASIAKYLLRIGVSPKDEIRLEASARMAVRQNLTLAKQLGIDSTPTLCLVNEKGEVYWIRSPLALPDLLH